MTKILANTPEYLEGDLRVVCEDAAMRIYTMTYIRRTVEVQPSRQYLATDWVVSENGTILGHFDTMNDAGVALITGKI